MKNISFKLTHNLYTSANSMIREKSDILRVLFDTLPEVLEENEIDNGLGSCQIIVGKMSRIIYTLVEDGNVYKKFSINFPFTLKENTNESEDILTKNKWMLYDMEGELVTSQIVSILKILNDSGAFSDRIDSNIELFDLYEQIIQACHEVELDATVSEKIIWRLIRHLFLFEPGYLRYDFDDDEKRCNEITHPLHHLDFYFSGNVTMRLGIAKDQKSYQHWKHNSFERLINNDQPCYYLKLP